MGFLRKRELSHDRQQIDVVIASGCLPPMRLSGWGWSFVLRWSEHVDIARRILCARVGAMLFHHGTFLGDELEVVTQVIDRVQEQLS
jgi:hypothetical protein